MSNIWITDYHNKNVFLRVDYIGWIHHREHRGAQSFNICDEKTP